MIEGGPIQEAVRQIRTGARFLVACHRRPDADSLGSAIGLIEVLRTLGKEATLFMPEPVPPALHFLVEEERALQCIAGVQAFDSTWVMDIAARKLLPRGLPADDVTGTLVVVDHHHAHDDLGDVVVRDTEASATGEVVIDLIEAIGLQAIPPKAATPLYAAIISDTGGFRYPSTTAATLRLGARLVEAGADPWAVAYELFECWPQPRLRLLAAILDTLCVEFEGRVAVVRVTRKMLADCGATDDMVEGMVNYARRVEGAEIGALLWEWPAHGNPSGHIETKISLRSSGTADVSKVAQALGGGGHRGAAATQLDLSIEDAASALRSELASFLG